MTAESKFLDLIFENIYNHIFSSDFVEAYKKKKFYFSRPSRCKLTFQMLPVFLLHGVKYSIQVEMNEFLSKVNPMCLSYSKQAFSKRRNCIKWEAFQDIFLTVANDFYKKSE